MDWKVYKMTDVKQKLQYVCSQPWSFVKVTAKFQLKCPVKGSRVYTKMQNMKSIEHFWQRYLVQAKRNFGLKTILHKECFAMVGNVHFKLGFIDKLVWHFEKLHKFQFNQQGGGRGTFLSTFYPRILCDKSQRGTSSKEFELRNF